MENIIGGMSAFPLRGLIVVTVVALGASPTHADTVASEIPVVTPYRPSVSTPAALSAPGWLEIEAGVVNSDGGEPAKRDSLPYTFKYAFSPDWGIRLQGEALVRDEGPQGQRITGFGDTALVLKTRFPVNARSAFGLELGVGAATARPGLNSGSGKTDYSLNGIYSADFASVYHIDLNYTVSRLGEIGPAGGRLQGLWATALSRGIGERWGIAGEFSGTHEVGVERTAQALVAASFTPAHRVSWDFGVTHGLTTTTPNWSLFAGVTILGHAF